MKQASILTMLTLFLCMVSVKALAYDFEKDGIYYNIKYSSSNTIFGTSYYITGVGVTYGDIPYSGHITLPEYVYLEQKDVEDFKFNISINPSTQIPVSRIDKKAFYNCDDLESIDIPNIREIGDSAFACCIGLKEILIPSSLYCIYAHAFQGCTNLESVEFEEKEIENTSSSRTRGVSFDDFEVGDYAFDGCVKLKHIDLSKMVHNGKFYIGKGVFRDCVKLETIMIPAFSHPYFGTGAMYLIGSNAFEGCIGLKDVYTYLQSNILDNVFDESTYENAFLHVPEGKIDKYSKLTGWKKFKNIVEIPPLTPIEKEVDYSGENNKVYENTNLIGTVIDNVYYNISSDNGGFDSDEKCLVVNKAMSDDEIEEVFGKKLLSDEVKEKYTGLVIEVPAGKGKVAVDAQTSGGMTLMVKVGASDPIEMELEGKLKMKVPYNVTEPTYVYIYAGHNTAAARTRNGEMPSLKIYGISLELDGDINGDKKVNVADIVKDINDNDGINVKNIVNEIMRAK